MHIKRSLLFSFSSLHELNNWVLPEHPDLNGWIVGHRDLDLGLDLDFKAIGAIGHVSLGGRVVVKNGKES